MSTLAEFADLAEAIGQARKRLDKASLLASFWARLDDTHLLLAARYISGLIFAHWDQRVLQLGHSTLLKALSSLSDEPLAELRAHLVRLGDIGDLAEQVLPKRTEPSGWTLPDLEAAFARLVQVSKPAARAAALQEILQDCTPREAKYVTKLVLGDLRIGLKEGHVEDALARAFATDVAAVQWANMLLGDPGETAVRARHGQLDSVSMRLFHPLKFMLASPAASVDAVEQQFPGDFVMEDKYDGIRLQAHISGDDTAEAAHGAVVGERRVALFSRTLDDVTGSFPELLQPLASLVGKGERLVLDGEALAMQDGVVLPFAALQKRLGRKAPSAAILEATPVSLMVFDVLVHNEEVVLTEPWTARRAILDALPQANPRVLVAPSQTISGTEGLDAAFVAAQERGNEGLMLKALDSTYKPGRRGRDWLKVKRPRANLDVVITAAEVGHGKRHTVLSDYTFAVRRSAEDGTLVDIGKAYSGLTDAEIAELSAVLRQSTLQILQHGKLHRVEPQVVLEITFDRVQASTRYASGYALRFPRILRWRRDKPVGEVDVLASVAALAQ